MEKKSYISPKIMDVVVDLEIMLQVSGGDGPNPPESDSKLREFYSDDSESSSEFFPTNFGDF